MTLPQIGFFLVGMMGIVAGSLNVIFSEPVSRGTRSMLVTLHYPNVFVSLFSAQAMRLSGLFGVLVGSSFWMLAYFG